MKYMKISDLEPGDVIKIGEDLLWYFAPFAADLARKCKTVVNRISTSCSGWYVLEVSLINEKNGEAKSFHFDLHESESKAINIVELT